jgi:hypothetical protein
VIILTYRHTSDVTGGNWRDTYHTTEPFPNRAAYASRVSELEKQPNVRLECTHLGRNYVSRVPGQRAGGSR